MNVPAPQAVVTVMNDKKKRRPGAAAQIAHSEKLLNSMQATSMEDVHLTMDQLMERKMRQEIVDKQKAALQGKAFQKEWDYAKYENRVRRINSQLKEVEVRGFRPHSFHTHTHTPQFRSVPVHKGVRPRPFTHTHTTCW